MRGEAEPYSSNSCGCIVFLTVDQCKATASAVATPNLVVVTKVGIGLSGAVKDLSPQRVHLLE